MDLAVVRVGQLRALLLWSDAGEAAEPVTQTELPLVLTAAVRQTPSHTAQALGSGSLLVTKQESVREAVREAVDILMINYTTISSSQGYTGQA